MENTSIKTRLTKFLLYKRKLLEVEAKPILLLLLIRTISLGIGTFRVFEFPALLIIIGLPLAYLIRKHLKLTCQFHWYVTAASISLILVPFIFVVLGFLNINFVFVFSIVFLYILALCSCVLLIIIGNDDEIKELGFFTSDKYLDLLGITLISLVIIKFTLTNFSHTFPGWDTFTFWGLDANYIFKFNKLRDATFTVTGDIRYLSLFPVMYSIVYDFFGKIVEQYGTWLNIFILAVGSLQVYFFLERKSLFVKLLGLCLIIAVMTASESASLLLYFYSDVYCAFLLLQYALYLTSNTPAVDTNYAIRILLILLPLIALGFVKTGLFALSWCLVFIFLLHDYPYLKKNISTTIKSKLFITILIFLLSLILLRIRYLSSFPQPPNSPIFVNQNTTLPPLGDMIAYAQSLIFFFAKKSLIISTLWCLQVIVVIAAATLRRINREGIFILIITTSVLLIFIGGYIVTLMELVSGSLARYTSIVMFVMLLNLQFIDFSTSNKLLMKFEHGIGYLGISLLVLFTISGILRQLPFKLLSGIYSDSGLKGYYEFTNKILEYTGADAKILIAADFSDTNTTTNMITPAIFIRYYLMNNSVGGQYNFIDDSKIIKFAVSNSADYILLLSYVNMFSDCANNLIEGENYLIRLSDLKSVNADICVNLDDAAIPLQ